jgi:hypothetical protein
MVEDPIIGEGELQSGGTSMGVSAGAERWLLHFILCTVAA